MTLFLFCHHELSWIVRKDSYCLPLMIRILVDFFWSKFKTSLQKKIARTLIIFAFFLDSIDSPSFLIIIWRGLFIACNCFQIYSLNLFVLGISNPTFEGRGVLTYSPELLMNCCNWRN